MKLSYSYSEIAAFFNQSGSSNETIETVAYDTRKLTNGSHALFFALEGTFRDGHDFISDAYQKGVRHFVVRKTDALNDLDGVHCIVVTDTLQALMDLAHFHRKQFDYPVVAITGSYGKTTVKEWTSELLSAKFRVIRSPKSYNSRLGVALSLLEMSHHSNVAVIEAGIAEPGDMKILKDMIEPTHGIFTGIGQAHRENFQDEEHHLAEKISLFEGIQLVVYHSDAHLTLENGLSTNSEGLKPVLEHFPYSDIVLRKNCSLAVTLAQSLGLSNQELTEGVKQLHPLAMRLETFDGIHGNTIINDAYQLDPDSLRHALEYQMSTAGDKPKVVIIGDENNQPWVTQMVQEFAVEKLIFHQAGDEFPNEIQNRSILIKGTRSSKMEQLAALFRLQKHQTHLQIDLKAIRSNIRTHLSRIPATTKLLCMVKAYSYGSDAKKIGLFLEQTGVHYLGVAYPDEGIELRKNGIHLPILVMNCPDDSFEACVEHHLEPAIYSLRQLENFIHALIGKGASSYPIHIKLETGMHRLGFEENEIPALIAKLKAQPEIRVKSIYSHLADADNPDSPHAQLQIERFDRLSTQLQAELPGEILRHILNSEGVANYPDASFDMVRLGIGMYGISGNLELEPAISWFSTVSQIKQLTTGDAVGYGRSFIAEKDVKIAVIPVGYADGFRRVLGQGMGGVYIHGNYCPTVGNVCMDMIMVDVTHTEVQENDRVELIGEHQSIQELAQKLNTIPYEIMTAFSPRIHRVYLDN